MQNSKTIILGVTASDAHVVANKLIEKLLLDHGFDVVNLGACTTVGEFCEAYTNNKPALAIVIGSLNGHAVNDVTGLKLAKRYHNITCPVIMGGNLSVGSQKDGTTVNTLYQLGVDSILDSPQELLEFLQNLVEQNEQAMMLAGQNVRKQEVNYVVA
jgi:methylaspartate mutase sigma subunit